MISKKVTRGVYDVTFSQVDSKGNALEVDITVQKCYDRGVWVFGGYVTRCGFQGRFPDYLTFPAETKREVMEYLKQCAADGFDY